MTGVKYLIKKNSEKGKMKSKGRKLDYREIGTAQATIGSQSDSYKEDVVLVCRRSFLTAAQLSFCVSTRAKDLLAECHTVGCTWLITLRHLVKGGRGMLTMCHRGCKGHLPNEDRSHPEYSLPKYVTILKRRAK